VSSARPLEFGANVDPTASELPLALDVARLAETRGLDLVGVQDHPYQRRFLDTWVLMATVLVRTERVRVFPNVANLPLRGPAMIAKAAASLDIVSGGRFELGLGAGSFWEAIAAMGGPTRTPGEAVDALEEAIRVIRLFWSGERAVSFDGRFYGLDGVHPGPEPAHEIGVWVGALKPRMLALTGRLGDGWSVSLPYAPPERIPEMQARIDEAAAEAGRDPAAIRRLYNVMGTIDDARRWVDELTRFVLDLGFDTFVFWPREDTLRQLDLFAAEVVPAVREAVARERAAP
jgi:alkanesulfonate monooxygenase SsuD/methylene tetrahydromethanopterin reductase-like flavin-dependent oxidoreductase (luciferase family)